MMIINGHIKDETLVLKQQFAEVPESNLKSQG